jgi:hydrogenase maturation protease
MSRSLRAGVLVAGIGNPDRGDDGFGPAVARRLRGQLPAGVCVVERSGDILALIADWEGFADVFVVDAVAPMTEPGRSHRFDLRQCPLPIGFAYRSTHGFGVAEAVELARNLGRLPYRLVLYLVEGASFEIGAPLSPAVAKAVDPTAARIVLELAAISTTEADEGAAGYA